MTGMREVLFNGRWPLIVPDHRAVWLEAHMPWEEARVASMYSCIEPGMVVFDIGSECGDLSALYATWGALVVLFEPSAHYWPNIRATFDANIVKPLACFPGFAGDEDRPGFSSWDIGWPRCAYEPINEVQGFCNLWERPDISAITLDTFAEYRPPIDAITIDVEGAELLVLRGAEEVLNHDRPLVWVSVHPDFARDMYSDDVLDIPDFMYERGYEGTLLAEDHELHYLYTPRRT